MNKCEDFVILAKQAVDIFQQAEKVMDDMIALGLREEDFTDGILEELIPIDKELCRLQDKLF